MKVAYYSPLPPERTGVADYTALLLPALARRLDLSVVKRRGRPPRDADVSVYHIGNSPEAHGWILDALRRRPGVVVLHEFVLHHLVAGLTAGAGDGPGYLAAMEREAGLPGRLLAYGVLDGRVPPLWAARPEDFPLVSDVLELASDHGLIVHSRYVEERVRSAGFEGRVWRIAHPAWTPPPVDPANVEGDPLVATFGNLNPTKGVPQLLEAFARLRETRPGARLLIAGAVSGLDLDRPIAAAGLDDAVIREPHVPEERLWALLRAADVCVLLRSPTMGETSGGVIRALSVGVPLVVSDVGWFSELPDEVALKVMPGEREVETLAAALSVLAEPDARAAMRESALAYVRREHDLDRVADAYAAALEEAAGGPAVRDAVLRDVAAAAADVGIAAASAQVADVGRALREIGLR